eukprot:c19044_g1_i1 orf=765-1943(-)
MGSPHQLHNSVLILIGDYVEDYEVMVPFHAFQAYGLKVDVVCPGKKSGEKCITAVHDFRGHQTYFESRGHNFILTATFDELDFDSYDALVIPGGRSPEYLSLNESVLSLVKKFAYSNKPIGALCHGQLILVAADVLKEKKCTAYPAVKPAVVAAGGHWIDPDSIAACIVDGNLVTGAGWPGLPEFMRLLTKALGATFLCADKRVLVLCGDFMEDYEVMVPFQALQALGYTVDGICPGKKAGDICPTAVHDFEGAETYSEKPGHNFTLTATFDEVNVDVYDALVIPGGRAPEYLALDEKVLEIVKKFAESKKPIASICHGQQILAAAGILKGKKCTAYPAVKPQLIISGAQWLEPEPISKSFIDGNLITAAAWPALSEFVSQLITLLGTKVTF